MAKKCKLYIISGEASGDLHGSNFVKELLSLNAASSEKLDFEFRYWGGDKMEEAIGVPPAKHICDLAFMGFLEVLKNIKTILNNIKYCKQDILDFKPDAIFLIDYPGFNLRIAQWAKENGIKVYYYISPTVWAWKESRVHKIKKSVDHMFVILPFEKPFYDKYDYPVEYVGHPLLDAIEQYRSVQLSREEFLKANNLSSKPIIALLPGSRKQEIKLKLPEMLKAVHPFTEYQVIVAGAPSLDPSFYNEFMRNSDVRILHGKTYDLLCASELAAVTSGTATLETALLGIPQVVCYKTSSISYSIAKRLVKIKFISLVNLIMDKEVVKELIQNDCNYLALRLELMHVMKNGEKRDSILHEYEDLIKLLGEGGASKKVAQSLLKTIRS